MKVTDEIFDLVKQLQSFGMKSNDIQKYTKLSKPTVRRIINSEKKEDYIKYIREHCGHKNIPTKDDKTDMGITAENESKENWTPDEEKKKIYSAVGTILGALVEIRDALFLLDK